MIYASNILSQSKPSSDCVFCNDNRHISSRCRKVTNVRSRRDILVKKGRYFICFDTGHRAKSCRVKYTCKKCKGRHNIAICENSDRKSASEEQPTSTSSNQILAQLVILGIVVANARQKERNRVLIVLRPLVVFCCKQLQVRLSL